MICDSFQRSHQYSRIQSEIAQSEANPHHLDLDDAPKSQIENLMKIISFT